MDMEVQKFLRNQKGVEPAAALGLLVDNLNIRLAFHPTDPLVILNYGLVDSPKYNPIVRECRGLTLELGTWNIVARAFPRFFNAGECSADDEAFNWCGMTCQEKCDGSLAILYYYNGSWRVNTRGSFAKGEMSPGLGKTWEEVFWECLRVPRLKELHTSCSFVFELCSPFNKIVRNYSAPTAFLLTAFSNEYDMECLPSGMDLVAQKLGVERPKTYHLDSFYKIQEWLKTIEDATFEGVVVRDSFGRRLKIKNARYVALHHLRGEGNNLFHPRHLMPFLLSEKQSEVDELIIYFPEVAETFNRLRKILDDAKENMLQVWMEAKNFASQKDFALYILPRTVLSPILFQARKENAEPMRFWRDNADLLLKTLFHREASPHGV